MYCIIQYKQGAGASEIKMSICLFISPLRTSIHIVLVFSMVQVSYVLVDLDGFELGVEHFSHFLASFGDLDGFELEP